MTRTVIKTERFEARANVESKSVSLMFEDRQGNEVEIWLGDGAIFHVLGQIQEPVGALTFGPPIQFCALIRHDAKAIGAGRPRWRRSAPFQAFSSYVD